VGADRAVDPRDRRRAAAQVRDARRAGRHLLRQPDGLPVALPAKGFTPLPRRWVVERTLAWLKRCRRLSVDRERTVVSSEALIQVAMIHLMLNRLRPTAQEAEFHYRKVA
jgi:putative transposase